MPNSAKWHSSKTQVLCGFEPNSAISLSQALGQRLLCCPKRGTSVPPFWEVGEGRTYGPCNPLRAVELCSTPRKFFEKNLTKNFYLSLSDSGAGI